MVLGQIGGLLAVNLAFTFFVPNISITGHLGGLAVGLVLGWLIPPSPAFTLAGQWQAASGALVESTSMYLRVVIYLGVAALLVAGTWVVMSGTLGTHQARFVPDDHLISETWQRPPDGS